MPGEGEVGLRGNQTHYLVAEWIHVSYRSGAPLSPPCPGPSQPRDQTAWAPSPAARLAKLVKAPAVCLLGRALGPFKLVSPGRAVIPILQRRKLRLRENSLLRLAARVVGVQPLCTPFIPTSVPVPTPPPLRDPARLALCLLHRRSRGLSGQ